jgi:L-alanine-DL-glutamate epimerase-like enolase superfamily enzyme
LEYAENVIVRIHTKAGIICFGECSPFMTINGESMETCFVVAQYLSKKLIGCNALHIESCVTAMDSVIYANSSIKSAFDMALYDIASLHAGMPLYQYLGGKKGKVLITDYTVSFDSSLKMAMDAAVIQARGFQVIKVKLGGSKEADVERIWMIREKVGMEIPIRIDANQGWDAGNALSILQELAPYNIQHCEEPIPRWDFMNLPAICLQSPIKIMADESCCDHHDAKRLIDLKACDYFNIKLGKSGGIYKAKKMIAIAEANQIKIQLGGFLESRLAFTAAAHLALCSTMIVHCDFDTPLMFTEDPVKNGIGYTETGEIIINDKPGIGASFEEGYLKGLKSIVVK